MVEKQWLALTDRFSNIQLHEYVIMPNHFHGILEIIPNKPNCTDVGAIPCGRPLLDGVGRPLLDNNVGRPLLDNNVGRPLLDNNDGRPLLDNNVGRPLLDGVGRPFLDNNDGRPLLDGDGRPLLDNENLLDNDRPLNGRSCIGQPQGHAPTTVAKRKTVGDMLDAFKSITTVEYIRGVKNMGLTPFIGKLWQRDYYEHIIRDYDSFVRISEYIRDNPRKWDGK